MKGICNIPLMQSVSETIFSALNLHKSSLNYFFKFNFTKWFYNFLKKHLKTSWLANIILNAFEY